MHFLSTARLKEVSINGLTRGNYSWGTYGIISSEIWIQVLDILENAFSRMSREGVEFCSYH